MDDLSNILLCVDSLTRFSFAYSSWNGSLEHPFAGRFPLTRFSFAYSLGNGSLEYTFVCGFSHQVLLCIQLLVMDLLSKVFLHVDSLTRFAYACSYW